MHLFVVSSWFDAMTFAIYSVGCLQIPLAEVVSMSVVNVMMVGMVQAIRDGREAAVVPMWHDTVRKLALIFFPFAAILLITAQDLIIFLFTDAYAASVPIFRTWSLVVLLSAIPMDGLLRVYAQTPFLLFINVVKFILVGGGNLLVCFGNGLDRTCRAHPASIGSGEGHRARTHDHLRAFECGQSLTLAQSS